MPPYLSLTHVAMPPTIHAPQASSKAGKRQVDPAILSDLVKVLAQHPNGLRRWSVMRAIRAERTLTNREIPLRLEDTVERTFRSLCEDFLIKSQNAQMALFYLRKETAGEVWAVHPERALKVLAGTTAFSATTSP